MSLIKDWLYMRQQIADIKARLAEAERNIIVQDKRFERFTRKNYMGQKYDPE